VLLLDKHRYRFSTSAFVELHRYPSGFSIAIFKNIQTSRMTYINVPMLRLVNEIIMNFKKKGHL